MLHLKRYDEGVWFDYPDNPGTRIKVRGVTNSAIVNIRSQLRKTIPTPIDTVIDGKKIQRIDLLDDLDPGAFAWGLFDHILLDWEGIEVEGISDKGLVKKAIFDFDPLRAFINEKSDQLAKAIDGKLAGELKNSESSQDGSTKEAV